MLAFLQRKNADQRLIVFLVSAVSIYAFYLRIAKLASHELHGDEYWQIQPALAMPFFDFVKYLPQIEYCPYISGDYILTYFFAKLFSYNKWGLAIPHIISTILGFYLLYLICKLHFKTIWGYLIAFTIVCFNATLIRHATEIRAYAVLPTLALATFYLFQRVTDLNFELNTSRRISFIIFLVFVIWFHVYGIAMVLLCFAYFLGIRFRTSGYGILFRKSATLLSIVFLIAAPLWLLSVFGPHVSYAQHIRINPFEFIPNPLVNIAGFLKAIFGNLVGNKKLYFLLIGIIFPFLMPFKERFRQIGFLFILIFIPIQLILLADLRTNYWFIQRQFIWVMPLFAFFIGWVWDSFFQYIQNLLKVKPRGVVNE